MCPWLGCFTMHQGYFSEKHVLRCCHSKCTCTSLFPGDVWFSQSPFGVFAAKVPRLASRVLPLTPFHGRSSHPIQHALQGLTYRLQPDICRALDVCVRRTAPLSILTLSTTIL